MKKAYMLFLITFLSGCAAAVSGNVAVNNTKWQSWQGRGHAEISEDSILYRPDNLQDEEYDYDIEGRGPALILSKNVPGKKWVLDAFPMFFSSDKVYNRFSFGLWIGKDGTRPSLASKGADAVVSIRRTRGPERSDNTFSLVIRDSGGTKTVSLPMLSSSFRFERDKNEIIIYYSADYKVSYKEAGRVSMPGKSSVLFFMGGRYDGQIFGDPRMSMRSLQLNGEKFF